MTSRGSNTRRGFIRGAGAALAALAMAQARSRTLHAFEQPNTLGQPAAAPSPQWEATYTSVLEPAAMGYTYAVAQNGRMVDWGGHSLARSTHERQNASLAWAPNLLFNLASVSKTITATAIMSIVQAQGLALLDQPFWDILTQSGRFSGAPGDGVESVTLRNLLTMRSGLMVDGTLYPTDGQSVDQFLAGYLLKAAVKAPGFYAYSNTNFTILGVLYEIWSGAQPGSYVSLLKQNVLAPLGVDPETEITDAPKPNVEGVSYSGSDDTRPGQVWTKIGCMAPGGWLGTAFGVLKFLMGLRTEAVLQAATSEMMFTQLLGWYRGSSRFGPYYHHNGGLLTGANPKQVLATGAIHFSDGYDAVLFVNSPANVIPLMARAFGAEAPEQVAPDD